MSKFALACLPAMWVEIVDKSTVNARYFYNTGIGKHNMID